MCALPLRLAAEEVYKAAQADNACSVHSDCVVRSARVRCSEHCPRTAVSARGAMELEQRLAQIERERCDIFFTEPGCGPLSITQNCSESVPVAARCVDGRCTMRAQGCGNGCGLVEGICRGDAHCDSCPPVVQDFVGMPCSLPGRRCGPAGFCPPAIRCRDDDEDGNAFWVEEIVLCSVQNAP